MALFGSLSTVRAQTVRPDHFASAFAHVDDCLREGSEARRRLWALEAGKAERVELGGGVFSVLQVYNTKARPEGKWESHLQYIDVQAVIAGEELMEVTDRSLLQVSENLTPKTDALLYHPFDQASVVRCRTGDVAIFFPVDAHLASLSVAASVLVRKVVVKVPVLA